MPGLREALAKSINRPSPELPPTGDTDILVNTAVAATDSVEVSAGRAIASLSDAVRHFMHDAPTCPKCGHLAVRNGACFKCLNCGESLGCS